MNKITRNITAILTIGLGSTLIANAQVTSQKIGTNPTMKQPSAVLEVESTNKGILTPRVTLTGLTDAVTIANPANALTVFNTATAGIAPNNVTPGYYYWSTADSKWVRLIDSLPQSVNIYNADGVVTDPRTATLDGNKLTFLGSSQQTSVNSDGSMSIEALTGNVGSALSIDGADNDANGSFSSLQIQVFSDAEARIYAVNDTSNLTLGTSGNLTSAPIIFHTAPGGGANGSERMRITGEGSVGIAENSPTEKLDVGTGNVRIREINEVANAGNITTDKVVVADTDGVLRTIDPSGVAIEPWLQATTEDKATLNTQNIYQNGNVGIDASADNVFRTVTPVAPLDVRGAVRGGQPLATSAIGEYSAAFGINNTASGFASMAWGYQYGAVPDPLIPSNTASGMAATAFGAGTVASGENATAFGLLNTASGDGALAFGSRNTASYSFSTAFGSGTLSEANAATAFGTRTHAGSLAETVIGINNAITTGDKDIRVDTDPLFQVGNGAGGLNAPASGAEPSNALTILKNGKTAIGVAGVEAAAKPTELLDLGGTATAGNGGLKIRNINSAAYAGNTTTDRVVVADTNGVLKTVPAATFAATNIYNSDGTLTGNRTVTTANNPLTFVGTGSSVGIFTDATEGRLTATGTERGSLTVTGGNSILDIYTDNNQRAQIASRGAGNTGLMLMTEGATPLSFRTTDVERMRITPTGEVAIGTTTAPSFVVGGTTVQPKLHIAGDVSTTGKYYTTNSVYADYVFEKYFKGSSDIKPDYEFKSLDYVKEFIEKEHHLPGVESISNLSKTENGYTFDMTKLTVQSLEKIEELYLHTIELKEKLEVQYQIGEQQEKMIQNQQKELEELKNKFSRLEELFIKQ